jgi:hypothetical protein
VLELATFGATLLRRDGGSLRHDVDAQRKSPLHDPEGSDQGVPVRASPFAPTQ